jgi:hypothetical protein
MSRKAILQDSSDDEEPSKGPAKSSSEEEGADDDSNAGAAAADDDEDFEPAPAAAAAAAGAAATPAAAKKTPGPGKKKKAAAAAAAAAAGSGSLGDDVVAVVHGILSQVLQPDLADQATQAALKQPEMQAVLQRLNSAALGDAAGAPGSTKKPHKKIGPSNYNVIVSCCLNALKTAGREAPMGLVAKAWGLLPKTQQQTMLERVAAAR